MASKRKATKIINFLLAALMAAGLWFILVASMPAQANLADMPVFGPGTPTPDPVTPTSLLPPLDTTENIFFERIGLDEGLSSGVVNVILQDDQGFLWFGTEDGLNRYDGYQFKVFRPDPINSNSLTDGWITSLIQSSTGDIWIGTRSGGLNRYDPKTGTFSHFIHNPNDPKSLVSDKVQVIYEDERGRLWIGTDKGLDQFYSNTQNFKHYYSSTHMLDDPIGDDITAIVSDQKGFLLIGTNGSGLKKFNPMTGIFAILAHDPENPFSISNNFVTCIVLDSNKNAWVGTQNGLNLYDPDANFYTPIFYHYNHSKENKNTISDNHIRSLYLDTNRNLWVGTDEGLNVFHRKTRSFIQHQHEPRDGSSLSFDVVTAIYQDEGGVLWVGTDGAGVNKYVRSRDKFAYFQNEETDPRSLSGNVISSILVDTKGYIWIGTMGDGLNIMQPFTGDFDHLAVFTGSSNTLSSDDIYSMALGPDGNVWIGTGAGLDRLNLRTGVFTHFQHIPGDQNSLPESPVTALFTNEQNRIWIGHNLGLSIYNPTKEEFTHYFPDSTTTSSLSGGMVTAIYQDSTGTIWVGTDENGLNRFNKEDESFTHYKHDPSDPTSIDNNSIQVMLEDSQGNLWIGTNGGGLNKYNQKTDSFSQYTDLHGLPSNIIYGIVEDDSGYLWLSTNYGISRFDPETESFSNYSAQDGLQGNEFNPQAHAKGKYGEIYFGGINGLTVFDPMQVTIDDYTPPLVLTAFTQDNQPVELTGSVERVRQITLEWPENYFEFEFVGLGYARPEKNQYAYMLENYDSDWFYSGNQRYGRYASLPGGEYTLLMKASNPDGIWSEEPLAIQITVIPPFWQTNWFRVTVGLASIFLIIAIYSINLNRVQKRSRELEALIQERTADLQKYTEELEALYSADEKILRTQTINQVFQALVEITVQMLHADGSAVFQWQPDQAKCGTLVSSGYTEKTSELICSHLSKLLNKDLPPHFSTTILTRDRGIIRPPQNGGQETSKTSTESSDFFAPLSIALAGHNMTCTLLLPIEIEQGLLAIFAASFVEPEIMVDDLYRLLVALVQRASLSIQNANLFERAKELAILEERNRLARDLHDSAKQKAFAALAQLGAANGIIKYRPEDVGPYMHEAENLVYDVIQELTFLIQEMYPMALKEKGLALTLRDYIFEWENRSDIDVRLIIENSQEMPLEKSQAIYRIVQEALANVARHSQANHATVHLAFQLNCAEVIIEDNGRGFNLTQKSNGMGLRSIRERVESNHGELEINSKSGSGTTITVRIPIERELDILTEYGDNDG